MKVVVDTSIIIDYIRGGSKWENFIKNISDDIEFYLPTIVIYELFSGESTRQSEHVKVITNFLKHFRRVELNEEIAIMAGGLYRDISKNFGVQDYVIAASALEMNAQILTLNIKHFQQIPNLKIYQY